jgi:PAS domain S-box-containing protein
MELQRLPHGELFAGDSELSALMRAKDWGATPLGPPETWPQSLKTCVRILLTSRQAMFVWWGDELINLYNDAYKAIVGGKHPGALGQPAAEVWREIWEQVGPRAEMAMRRNVGTYDEALLLIMERFGFPEETYYTFSYSPVPNDHGGAGGIICANTDDTQRIIGERQLALLREVGALTSAARAPEEACSLAAEALATNERDVPFALIYLVSADRRHLMLSGRANVPAGHPAAPEQIPFDAATPWQLAEVVQTHQPRLLKTLTNVPGELPKGAWDIAPHQAAVLPLAPQGETGRMGVLVVGLNPYRLYSADYERFLSLTAGQISAGIASAHAFEEERKRAEALAAIDRAKTAFFSNVSHEFRTPLTLMLAPLEDVLNTGDAARLPPVDRERLEVAHRNALRLLRLVNTLLDFSRIEAGRAQARYMPIDLATFTADLASGFRSAVERAGLFLAIECAELPGPVHVDREMWEKVVLNLVSNAFKFTFDGGITVRVFAREDGHVSLSVRDTGVGIPEAELPRVFERFHRIEGQRGRSFEGSGIGLALVHEMTRLHGGSIEVFSAPGQGTEFVVTLPMGAVHLDPAQVVEPAVTADTARRVDAYLEEATQWLPAPLPGTEAALAPGDKRPHVVLADDNADMRDYVRRLLADKYDVTAVTDGQAALDAIRAQKPDLVLSDVMMPVLDGFGLLRELRGDPALRDVPIILLSARAGDEARVEGLDAGADDYLTKPFSARELLARVGATLTTAQLRQDAMREVAEAADSLAALNQTLEALVAERTRERDGIWRTSQDLFMICGLDGVIRGTNPAWMEAVGYTAAELAGRSFETFWHPDEIAAGHALLADLAHGQVMRESDLRMRTKDGAYLRFNWHCTPEGDAFYAAGRDVTHRMQLEEQLRQAQKMEAVGQLTGGLAHDFNNLLTGIAGSLELLQIRMTQGRHTEVDRYVSAAQGACKRAAALTHRLLAFSRRQTLDPKPTDVNRLVAGMEELIRRTVGPAVTVEVVTAIGLWPTLIDPNQLESALLNLCINARDAMPDGGRLTIETANRWLDQLTARERDLPPGQYVSLCVSDTGTGMTPDVIARAFDPFFTTKPIGMGTGLGLSMIYGFAKQSGGQVRIYSEPDHGTMVCLYLPRHLGALEDADAPAEPAEAQRAQQGETVVIVDDEPTIRMLIVEVLRDLGYVALEAADAAAGLKILESGTRVDLLVTDVGLPGGMNGRQLADAARALRPRLQVLFITGYAENAVLGSLHLEAGMHVLTKPFAMEALGTRLRELIAG